MTVEESEGAETEVRREDQDSINRFSRLHQRSLTIQEDIETAQKILDDHEEVQNELALSLDEDERIPYRIGDSFVLLSITAIQTILEDETRKQSEHIAQLEQKRHSVEEEMTSLKVKLYARFGRTINLEA